MGVSLGKKSKDHPATNIVLNAIETAGGMERWRNIKELTFNKDFQLLDSLGSIEKDFRQIHTYKYNPVQIHIKSIENGDTIITEFGNNQYKRTINGRIVEASQESLAKSVNTSTYVIGIPFKLLDPGSVLRYEGGALLNGEHPVDIVSATYDADHNANHSTSDIWKYYFNKENNRVVANWVKASDHYSLVENLTYEEAGGLLFNGKRVSYRVDESGKKQYLRASYKYYNYKVVY